MSARYIQIADVLRAKAIHMLRKGEKRLPTESEIATRFAVSRQTVRNALELLEEEGLIERIQGSGSYIKEIVRKSSDSDQIAIITTFIDDYIFPSILHDAQHIFSSNGYTILLYATGNSVRRESEILRSLLQQDVRAIIIEGSKTSLPTPNAFLFEEFRKKDIPVLFFHGTYMNLEGYPYAIDDNEGGGRLLADYLISKGHRNIGGIFKSDDMQGPLRYSGVVAALAERNMSFSDTSFCWYETEIRKDLLESENTSFIERCIRDRLRDCSAIVCYNDEIAYTLIRNLISKGIDVPSEIAVVSFDNSLYSRIEPIPITSLGHVQRMGEVISGMMLDVLSGKEAESRKLGWVINERKSS